MSAGAVLAGRYRLDDQLASGGMAQVWRGTDEVLRRSIAVKILHAHLAADETFVTRFRHEAIAVARLSHPAIVNVYDTCNENGIDAIVMELVRGNTLRDKLDQGPVEPWSAANIAAQVAGALDVAHAAGLVHRDIKPANILLSEDGRVKVGDFGIAKAAESADLTETGSFVGTAKYLAPEQVESKPVDGRTDLYSLGIVLYEMLTGRVPFEADSASGTALARLHTNPQPPRLVNPGVPPALEAICMRLLARSPDDRFPSAADARAALLGAGADDRVSDVDATDGTVVGVALPPPPPGSMPTSSGGTIPPAHAYGPVTPGGGVAYRDPERRKLVPILLVVLVAVALAVAGLLLQRATSSDDGGNGNDEGSTATTAAPQTEASEPVALDETVSFDPPPGDGRESPNDAEAGFAIDGDPSTAWETERYNSPQLGGLKAGVGLIAVLEGEDPAPIRAVEIDSPSVGWRADIYIGDDSGDDALAPWGEPVATIEAGGDGGTLRTEDFDATGDAVLVWITYLGEGNSENRVELAEIRVLR